MSEVVKKEELKEERPSQIYLLGLNIFYWAGDVFVKSLVAMFLWNGGVTRISHAIPRIEFITCFSILFIISMIGRIIGNALMETAGIRLFILYQKNQQNMLLLEQSLAKKDGNQEY